MFKTVVIQDNIQQGNLVDDSKFVVGTFNDQPKKYVRLRLVDEYLHDYTGLLSFKMLQNNGLKGTLQGQTTFSKNPQLRAYIGRAENKKNMVYYRLQKQGNIDLFDIQIMALTMKVTVFARKGASCLRGWLADQGLAACIGSLCGY